MTFDVLVKGVFLGMKHAVREDPDIILVGELRDEETFMTAIHAAVSGCIGATTRL